MASKFHEMTIDLRHPPADRWHLTHTQRQQARELLVSYKADLGVPSETAEILITAVKEVIRPDHWVEIESLADDLAVPVSDAALGNFYYDALKVMIGCTAFAVDTGDSVLHARNLDWWSENGALTRYTAACRFVGGAAGEFITIGWPGFIGAFSGIAPGRFAVTLNAVLSLEPAQPATPVVLLLRTVLEEAESFDKAVSILSTTMIPCDCLLLVTGTRQGEMVVIERTPSRHAVRHPEDGFLCVTNDYRLLQTSPGGATSELLATACPRFDRIDTLIRNQRPNDPEACLSYLSDPAVKMQITVQQMAFQAATGEYWLRTPGPVDS